MGPIQRQVVKSVLLVVTYPLATLALSAALLAVCLYLAFTRLSISTDQNRLVSADLPFFRNYLTFIDKFPENEALYVVLEPQSPAQPPPPQRWMELADRITVALRQMPRDVKAASDRIPLDQLGDQALLFANWPQVKREAREAQPFVPLIRLFAERPGVLTTLAIGPTPIERYLKGLAPQKVQPDQIDFTALLADSWTQALAAPPSQWQIMPGKQIPDLQKLGRVAQDPSRLGYTYITDQSNPSNHLLLIEIYQNRVYDKLSEVAAPLERMRAQVNKVVETFQGPEPVPGTEAPSPRFRVTFTGRPAVEADEMLVSQADTERAEILAAVTVFVGLVIAFLSRPGLAKSTTITSKYKILFRAAGLALLAEISLAVAVGWTFGYATLAIGQLNLLSTVFVIALIGIGMDYLIQILTRYRQERDRYLRDKAIWARVFRYVSPPISTACFGAAGAFFVSWFTGFRGAAELGIIAGGGLLLSLLAGYTVLPALITLTRRRPATLPRHPLSLSGMQNDDRSPPAVVPAPWTTLILPVLWIVVVLALLPFAFRTSFNSNLLSLQPNGLPSAQTIEKLPTWYSVVLSKNLDELRAVKNNVETAAKAAGSSIDHTDSILSVMEKQQYLARTNAPFSTIKWDKPAPVSPARIGIIAHSARDLASHFTPSARGNNAPNQALSHAIDSLNAFATALEDATKPRAPLSRNDAATRLSIWQEKFEDELHAIANTLTPGPLNLSRLPEQLRVHYLSPIDQQTYAFYIYPKENDLSEQAKLEHFVKELESLIPATTGEVGVTGIAVQFFHSTEQIRRAFLRATAYALGLIFLLVLIDLHSLRQTLIAISVLGLGLPLLLELMGLLHISWNFANFFGLPILIGAGHEYGVFMVHRFREALHNPRRTWGRWDVSDNALLLCAYVTCFSFLYLALARHRGLQSLGLVMFMGIACIYLATLLVVRPTLKWWLSHRRQMLGLGGKP